jgi:hypothetical protein
LKGKVGVVTGCCTGRPVRLTNVGATANQLDRGSGSLRIARYTEPIALLVA